MTESRAEPNKLELALAQSLFAAVNDPELSNDEKLATINQVISSTKDFRAHSHLRYSLTNILAATADSTWTLSPDVSNYMHISTKQPVTLGMYTIQKGFLEGLDLLLKHMQKNEHLPGLLSTALFHKQKEILEHLFLQGAELDRTISLTLDAIYGGQGVQRMKLFDLLPYTDNPCKAVCSVKTSLNAFTQTFESKKIADQDKADKLAQIVTDAWVADSTFLFRYVGMLVERSNDPAQQDKTYKGLPSLVAFILEKLRAGRRLPAELHNKEREAAFCEHLLPQLQGCTFATEASTAESKLESVRGLEDDGPEQAPTDLIFSSEQDKLDMLRPFIVKAMPGAQHFNEFKAVGLPAAERKVEATASRASAGSSETAAVSAVSIFALEPAATTRTDGGSSAQSVENKPEENRLSAVS